MQNRLKNAILGLIEEKQQPSAEGNAKEYSKGYIYLQWVKSVLRLTNKAMDLGYSFPFSIKHLADLLVMVENHPKSALRMIRKRKKPAFYTKVFRK